MSTIYVPAVGLDDWRKLLAKPDRHWRDKYSAVFIASSWQRAQGFPAPVAAVLQSGGEPFASLQPLIILPEHQVPLPGSTRGPSQNDVWILARHANGLASITVEGKVAEPFDKTLRQWTAKMSDAKRTRLRYLTDTLGLPAELPGETRYQLLHRMVSAIIEAQRFHATTALFLVHSFSESHIGLADYQAFIRLFRRTAEPGEIVRLGKHDGVTFYSAWIHHPVTVSE